MTPATPLTIVQAVAAASSSPRCRAGALATVAMAVPPAIMVVGMGVGGGSLRLTSDFSRQYLCSGDTPALPARVLLIVAQNTTAAVPGSRQRGSPIHGGSYVPAIRPAPPSFS